MAKVPKSYVPKSLSKKDRANVIKMYTVDHIFIRDNWNDGIKNIYSDRVYHTPPNKWGELSAGMMEELSTWTGDVDATKTVDGKNVPLKKFGVKGNKFTVSTNIQGNSHDIPLFFMEKNIFEYYSKQVVEDINKNLEDFS